MARSRLHPALLAGLVLGIAGVAAYTNSFAAPFVFDDHRVIEEHSMHRRESLVVELREVDAFDLGAEVARDGACLHLGLGGGVDRLLGTHGVTRSSRGKACPRWISRSMP